MADHRSEPHLRLAAPLRDSATAARRLYRKTMDRLTADIRGLGVNDSGGDFDLRQVSVATPVNGEVSEMEDSLELGDSAELAISAASIETLLGRRLGSLPLTIDTAAMEEEELSPRCELEREQQARMEHPRAPRALLRLHDPAQEQRLLSSHFGRCVGEHGPR